MGRRIIALPSKHNFIHHYHWFKRALAEVDAEAVVPLESFDLVIRKDDKYHTFSPRFYALVDGVRQYASQVSDDAVSFAGWLPYKSKTWPIAVDKLAFKTFAENADLPVPAYSIMPDSGLENVLVKRANSSFGSKILGPFLSTRDHKIDRLGGEFYERFIEGSIAKIWYWNDEPVCMEIDEMPHVVGDGESTIEQLIMKRKRRSSKLLGRKKENVLKSREGILASYGMELNTILPKDYRQTIEFRYGSRWLRAIDKQTIDLESEPEHDLMPVLLQTGLRLVNGIPANIRKDTLFTVDAIIDGDGKLWLLEMNCNPTVHPLLYKKMVRSTVEFSRH